PLYGTYRTSRLARRRNNSAGIWLPPASAAYANEIVPGFDLARAASSWTVVAGTDGFTTRTGDPRVIIAIAVNDAAVSQPPSLYSQGPMEWVGVLLAKNV